MMTPNLDASGHQWVGALARFNFQLEYQKGHDNTVADVLSQVTTHLDPDMVRSIIDGITLGAAHQEEVLGAKGTCCHRPCASTNACY